MFPTIHRAGRGVPSLPNSPTHGATPVHVVRTNGGGGRALIQQWAVGDCLSLAIKSIACRRGVGTCGRKGFGCLGFKDANPMAFACLLTPADACVCDRWLYVVLYSVGGLCGQ